MDRWSTIWWQWESLQSAIIQQVATTLMFASLQECFSKFIFCDFRFMRPYSLYDIDWEIALLRVRGINFFLKFQKVLSDKDVRDIIFNDTALKEYTDDMKSEMTSEMKINSLYLIGIGLGVWIFGWIQDRVHHIDLQVSKVDCLSLFSKPLVNSMYRQQRLWLRQIVR